MCSYSFFVVVFVACATITVLLCAPFEPPSVDVMSFEKSSMLSLLYAPRRIISAISHLAPHTLLSTPVRLSHKLRQTTTLTTTLSALTKTETVTSTHSTSLVISSTIIQTTHIVTFTTSQTTHTISLPTTSVTSTTAIVDSTSTTLTTMTYAPEQKLRAHMMLPVFITCIIRSSLYLPPSSPPSPSFMHPVRTLPPFPQSDTRYPSFWLAIANEAWKALISSSTNATTSV
ncbi:hypothetical protein M422DRAFT_243989 [Sphaerobolus stellatus SS14]|nr:hypothetical protein M422DRAFT_243989 [Sphaerobolus stellatus SS14]